MQIALKGGYAMVTGTAGRDAEFKLVGEKQTPLCSFSLAVGKNPDTTTAWANCKAWGARARLAASIRKGDTALVFGRIEEREYQGKAYRDLVAEFMIVEGASAQAATSGAPSVSPAATQGQTSFSDLSEDDDLPF